MSSHLLTFKMFHITTLFKNNTTILVAILKLNIYVCVCVCIYIYIYIHTFDMKLLLFSVIKNNIPLHCVFPNHP